MNPLRDAFLEAADAARAVVAAPEVAKRWDSPSALAEFSVRGLAGHMVRATGSVEAYLEREVPAGAVPVSAAAYYAGVLDTTDLQSPLHQGVRARGEEEAAGGHDALVAKLDGIVARLGERLATEPPGRLVSVFKDYVLTLDDYLATRVVELVVHTDDLAVSAGLSPPAPPPGVADVAIETMLAVARLRHGDLGVIRALSRRERDAAEALRVF